MKKRIMAEKWVHDLASGCGVILFLLFFYQSFMHIRGGEYVPYYIVLTAFFGLLTWIYVRRSPARESVDGWEEWVVPLLVTFAPMGAFSLVPPSGDLVVVGYSVAAVGMAVCVWGLWYLRLNFSIFVEARECVSDGPYRFVRHPLYAGEIIAFIGLAMAAPSPVTAVTVLLLIAGQLYRAWMEERKLIRVFGDAYARVQDQTWWPFTYRI